MAWQPYGGDHSLVLHTNMFGEDYRISIGNADDFSNEEKFEIQEQADGYFDKMHIDDILEYGSYAGCKYFADFTKTELASAVCFELNVGLL